MWIVADAGVGVLALLLWAHGIKPARSLLLFSGFLLPGVLFGVAPGVAGLIFFRWLALSTIATHLTGFTKSSQNPCSRLTRSIQKPQLRLIGFRRIYCQLFVLVTAGTRGRSRHPVTSLTTETCPGVSVSPLRGGFGGYFAHHTGLTDRPSDPTYTNTYSNASVKRPPSLQPLFDYFLVVMRYSHTLNCFAGNRSR